jgi:hypothetical protein
MLVDIYFISKKSKKTKIIYLIVSLIIIGLLLQNYLSSLFSVFDTIVKNIITIIYFPSVLEYILMLIATLIIMLTGALNKKTNKKIKTINLFVFIINIFIFFLILDQISTSEVDLSNKVSIYLNENLMALFELSILIFGVWIIFLILSKIINKLINKNQNKIENKPEEEIESQTKEENKEEIINFYEEPELPKTIEELRKEELKPNTNIEYIVVEKKNDNDMFTLDEYRQMRKILEMIKENENHKNL